jgi:hypothetical protein
MYVTGMRVRGLTYAHDYEATEVDRVVELDGAVAVPVALGLDLFAAALDKVRLQQTMVRLDWASGDPEDVEVIEEDGLPVQVSLSRPHVVRAFLDETSDRRVTVTLRMVMDPPMFGQLRANALKDPRLVPALAAGAELTVRVGWLFTKELGVASLVVHEMRIGDVGFSMNERPKWLIPLLKGLAPRFHRVDWRDDGSKATERIHNAMMSPDREARAAAKTASEVLAGPPFDLGSLGLVRMGGKLEARFGGRLLTTNQIGPAAAEALRLVEAVYVKGPDVLVVEAPGAGFKDQAAVRAWLSSRMEGDTATIEQVFMVAGP